MPKDNPISEYRSRIYDSYVDGREHALAPVTIEGLRPRAPYLEKLVRDHFPVDRAAAVLDLGCGHGALMHFAQKAGYRNVLGMDRSPQQVAAARSLGIANVSEGDLLEALRQRPSGSVDAVVTFDVIEHFQKGELLHFVDEVFRVLRVGGRWIIHAPNGESPFAGRMLYWDFTHELCFTRTSIAQLLMSSGFARVGCHEDAPVPHGARSAVRWLLWQVIRGILLSYTAVETGAFDRDCIFSQNFLAVAIK
jgi:2-polyprenyl-3-methyl-5-hydroxy-6-metoxy-1,4-benzoquinol methylase